MNTGAALSLSKIAGGFDVSRKGFPIDLWGTAAAAIFEPFGGHSKAATFPPQVNETNPAPAALGAGVSMS